jgi:hypothetical protein
MLSESQRQSCLEAAEFVLLEIERFQTAMNSGAPFPQIFGEGASAVVELMAKIKYTETAREFTCGREALRRFRQMASWALAERSDGADFDASEVEERLRDTFLSYVFADVERALESYVDDWIEAAIRYVQRRHRARTHYLPCVALQIGQKETYSFGAVTFLRKKAFRDRAMASLQKLESAQSRLGARARRNAAPGLQWCWERNVGSGAKSPEESFDEFTRGVDWIAEVKVSRCATAVSEVRAEKALRAVLCCQTLLLQGTEGSELRLGQDPFLPAKTSRLSSLSEGTFRLASSMKFGMPSVEEGWQASIEDRGKPVIEVMEQLVNQILTGQTPSFGYQIALRAVTWYADAVRDPNVETRLIKCATAIECLVFPERGKATATFVIRGSLLAQRQGHPMSHWAPIAKRLYALRSDVAHGNVESLRKIKPKATSESLEFARNVVLQFLLFCRQLQPFGVRRIGTKEEFLELYRASEASFRDEIKTIVQQFGYRWEMPADAP